MSLGALETGLGTHPSGHSPGKGENGRVRLHGGVFFSYVYVCEAGNVHVSSGPHGGQSYQAGTAVSCEPPGMGAGSGTWVLCKNSVYF